MAAGRTRPILLECVNGTTARRKRARFVTKAIGLPEVPVARLGSILRCSGSKAALIRKRAVTILQTELRSDESGQAIADAVLELARTWTESWTI